MTHTIHKGFVGEIAVIKDLTANYTYPVFKPIIERRKKEFLRVQVKTISDMKTETAIEVRLHKYRHKDLIDIVAVYYVAKDMVCYVPYNNEASINLALKPSKNQQMKNRRYFYQYMEFPI